MFPALPVDRTRPAATRRLAASLALAVVLGSFGTLSAAAPVIAWDGADASAASEADLTVLTNSSRADAGLPTLPTDPELVAFARARSEDMAERDYFSHEIPPTGTMVFDIMTAAGYCYRLAGENIGWLRDDDDGAEAEVHRMFLRSPTHRSVLMGETWDAVGIGSYERADGRIFWTVLFADRCDDAAALAPAS